MVEQSRSAVARGKLAPPEAVKYGIDCVLLTCFESDFIFWEPFFRPVGIRMRRAQTLEEADFLLTVTDGTVLLMDVVFLDGSWDDALTMLARFHPLVASLVIADKVDGTFVSDALNHGAFGVLWKPIELDKLRRSIRSASEASEERSLWRRDRSGIVVPLDR
jgi:DNA-binding NtrC family response regulator